MMQPDKAAELLSDPAMVESGLMPRFLPFDSGAEPADVPEKWHTIPDRVKKEWRDLVRALGIAYRLSTEPVDPFTASEEAHAILRDFDNKTRALRRAGGDARDIAAFAARWAEQAWRMAVVIHAALHGDRAHERTLTAETAENAVRIGEWFIANQLRLFAASRSDRAEKLLNKLRSTLVQNYADQTATLRDLKKRHHWKEGDLFDLAKRFRDHLEIIHHQPPGGGRPTSILRMKS